MKTLSKSKSFFQSKIHSNASGCLRNLRQWNFTVNIKRFL